MNPANPEKENANPRSDYGKSGINFGSHSDDNHSGSAVDCDDDSASTKSKQPGIPRIPEADDFTLLKPISRGAFGKVFIGCKKKDPDKIYAIKVMKKSDLINKNLIAQVTTERDALAMIHSPFVVEIYYSLQSEQNIYLVMEYLAGGDMKSLLAVCGYLEEDMAAIYVAEVTLALEHLHRKGIIHRDLKPDNMLIAGNGHIKLTDFGLSKVSLDVNTTPVAANQLTPMSRLDQYRTPGQVLSLRSSLAFSAPRLKEQKRSTLRDGKTRKSLLSSASPTTSCRSSGVTAPSPLVMQQTPNTLKQSCQGMSGTVPAGLTLTQSGLSPRNPKPSTPLIKCLTPTLQDSLRWKHSSSMDTIDPQSSHSSSLFTGNLSHIHGNQPLHDFSLSSNDDVFSSTHHELKDLSDMGATPGIVEEGSLECPSHDRASSKQESLQGGTPVLHRTHKSVHSSFSARSLRNFQEGSSLDAAAAETMLKADASLLQHSGSNLESVPEESESQQSSQCSLNEANQAQERESASGLPPNRKRSYDAVLRDSAHHSGSSAHTELTQEVLVMQLEEAWREVTGASRHHPGENSDQREVSMDCEAGHIPSADHAPRKVRITSRYSNSSESDHSSPPGKTSGIGEAAAEMGIRPLLDLNLSDLFSNPALSSPETEAEDANMSLLSEGRIGERSCKPFCTDLGTMEGKGREGKSHVKKADGVGEREAGILREMALAKGDAMSENQLPVKPNQRTTKTVDFKEDTGSEPLRRVHCMNVTNIRLSHGAPQNAVDWTEFTCLRTPDRSVGRDRVTIHSDYITPQRQPLSLSQLHRTPKEGVRRGPEPRPQEEDRILGTPDYLAPEILRQETHGPAVDWWALGVCLFELLTGLPPFNDETPELVFRNILNRAISWPTDMEELGEGALHAINSLLTMDPRKRPGAPEVKVMSLFSKLDWNRLLDTEPPFIPQPDNIMDTSYFDPKNTMQQLTISAVDM